MRVYIGFDDTDMPGSDIGTGKLARYYEQIIPPECKVWGVLRQQLLVDPGIPYTSHNSSACVVVDYPDPAFADILLKLAMDHVESKALPGSDPGLCFTQADHPALPALQAFGLKCTRQIVTQSEARQAVGSGHLSGHGGTNGGIIGAAAGVGLTASGWSGRFIEFARLRELSDPLSVSDLRKQGIRVVSLDRDACLPCPEDNVNTKGWLRPRLWGHEAVLPVNRVENGLWESLGEKRNQDKKKMKEV